MNNLTNFIRIVLSQSKLAMEKGEIPIASVIVDPIDERIIARSFNQEIESNDPTAHAEILCIRKACKKLNQKRLDGLIMISYLEPCHMCKEVIKSSRLSAVYYLFKNDESITWPVINNRLSLRLENINTINNLYEGMSHDAEVDVSDFPPKVRQKYQTREAKEQAARAKSDAKISQSRTRSPDCYRFGSQRNRFQVGYGLSLIHI